MKNLSPLDSKLVVSRSAECFAVSHHLTEKISNDINLLKWLTEIETKLVGLTIICVCGGKQQPTSCLVGVGMKVRDYCIRLVLVGCGLDTPLSAYLR